ncbi:cytochrome C oxidase subunit III [Halarcobacter ebronensis]|uniref:Cytochrome C oxidase subunit III n=1 Tax=Halarcobacter ebronensis TaxID=1462615 RepID=A0A4Q0YCE8_9BACT|nr:c-type cytochrome [Halarcobacter ebronensis]RXJ67743.1 cytochrome C oxidase subunit III [Halarcobacter ebronensis]
MKLTLFLVLFPLFLFCKEDDNSFITKFEYGAMLYENPRGIGCVKCHEKGDKDVLIAQYSEFDKKSKGMKIKSIIAPAINKVSFQLFIDKMTADKTDSKIMPTYFLTDEELKSLYYYIKNINKK